MRLWVYPLLRKIKQDSYSSNVSSNCPVNKFFFKVNEYVIKPCSVDSSSKAWNWVSAGIFGSFLFSLSRHWKKQLPPEESSSLCKNPAPSLSESFLVAQIALGTKAPPPHQLSPQPCLWGQQNTTPFKSQLKDTAEASSVVCEEWVGRGWLRIQSLAWGTCIKSIVYSWAVVFIKL